MGTSGAQANFQGAAAGAPQRFEHEGHDDQRGEGGQDDKEYPRKTHEPILASTGRSIVISSSPIE
jgi:hypothetical protein